MGILEIARRSGYSGAHISKIFNGGRNPSFQTAARIAAALGISTDTLYLRLMKIREDAAEEVARRKRIADAREKDKSRRSAWA